MNTKCDMNKYLLVIRAFAHVFCERFKILMIYFFKTLKDFLSKRMHSILFFMPVSNSSEI